MFEVTITGPAPKDPRERVLAIEGVAEAICRSVGEDAADGVMMLLTAAFHIAMKHSDKTIGEMAPQLSIAFGNAIVCAHDFFKLRVAPVPAPQDSDAP